jgi:AcrR family transcriptional regulator
MPRIQAPTVALNREQRRAALLEAAAALILRDGTFTVAEVAAEVGLSRSAVYEYYTSAADLIADVLIDELAEWSSALALAVECTDDPHARIEAWVQAVLDYVADGRHALVRAAAGADLSPTRRAEVQSQHRDLVAPLTEAIRDAGVADPAAAAGLAWGAVDAAIGRIEAGATTVEVEAPRVIAFVRGGLQALAR